MPKPTPLSVPAAAAVADAGFAPGPVVAAERDGVGAGGGRTTEPPAASGLREALTPLRLATLDVGLIVASWFVGWTLRFEGLSWRESYGDVAFVDLATTLPIFLGALLVLRAYRRVWSLASVDELELLLRVAALAAVLNVLCDVWLLPSSTLITRRVPIGVTSHETMWALLSITLPRLGMRIARWRQARQAGVRQAGTRALVLGAGGAGQLTAREILGNPSLGLRPVGFLDDDVSLHGRTLCGLPVLGRLEDVTAIAAAHDVREIVLAMPTAAGRTIRRIVRECADVGLRTRTVPGISEILSGAVGVSQLRDVQIEDLLRREPVSTDLEAVATLVRDRTVLVTGAGGSIGSELCRQLVRQMPARLVLLGHGENSIFEIHHELRDRFPGVPLSCVIADVRDAERIDEVFARFRPSAVFHAAAHKHVPLMEENLVEAVTNNVQGTRVVVEACARHGTTDFVLISSDKAVNPTSIMGSSKRIAEIIVQTMAERTGRNFVSVRFGNVLGSRGSVVPMFLRQIRSGGPVTITHPEMTRYFMTIPEAVQLVLQAACLGRGGEVFVLDMGEPVKIVDLASDLIRLSGLQVGTDIEIRFTGMRPGEKLFEELSRNDENLAPTQHHKVLRARLGAAQRTTWGLIDDLVRAAARRESDELLRGRIFALVPEYSALGAPSTPTPAAAPGLSLVA